MYYNDSDSTTLSSSTDTSRMFAVPAYDEESVCSQITTDKYSYINWRFRVFDEELDTSFFTLIDTICVTGYVQNFNDYEKINVEIWQFRDSSKADIAFRLLNIIEKRSVAFKPPTFWSWLKRDSLIIFFYSLELHPSSLFYKKVKEKYMDNIVVNCCIKSNYFNHVKAGLLNDSKSYSVFRELHDAYLHDRSFNTPDSLSSCLDLKIYFYNKGTPLVRLLSYNSLINTFSIMSNQNRAFQRMNLRRHYVNLVSDIENYRTDDDIGEENGQQQYFTTFLTSYYIIPSTK